MSFTSVVALVGLSVLFMVAEPVAAQDLKGKITTEQLYANAPVFRENAQKFTPDAVAVKRIREIDGQLKIVMFLRHVVPGLEAGSAEAAQIAGSGEQPEHLSRSLCGQYLHGGRRGPRENVRDQGRAHDDLLQGRQRAGPHHRIAGRHDGKRFPQDHRTGFITPFSLTNRVYPPIFLLHP